LAKASALVALASLGVSACTIGTLNGQLETASSTLGVTLYPSGYYDRPDVPISIEVLENPDELMAPEQWTQLALVSTSTTATSYHDPAPLYAWGATINPVSTAAETHRWLVGGLVRIRAIAKDVPPRGDHQLTTLDEDFWGCLNDNATESWEVVGLRCASNSTSAALVSTARTPDDPGATHPPYLSVGDPRSIAAAYYASTHAPRSFPRFLRDYHEDTATDEARAVYYNDGDLGIGREMHCWSFPTPQVGGGTVTARACYVKNYGVRRGPDGEPVPATLQGGLQPLFGSEWQRAANDAADGLNSFATVAMAYFPPSSVEGAADPANAVRFVVYNDTGALQYDAQLDAADSNRSVPQNCLVCHGGSSSIVGNGLSGQPAHFLPFDLESFRYADRDGMRVGEQNDSFRRLNEHVLATNPTPAIRELITGWYDPAGTTIPAGATAIPASASFHGDFVPRGWRSNSSDRYSNHASEKLYSKVVKPFCRTCHVSQSTPPYDWSRAVDFSGAAGLILDDVCNTHKMPRAQQTMGHLWNSSARAYLVGMAGSSYHGSCKP
jgi:hypothetical protein